ncbi:hypothetical protein GGF40_001936 [Coemansia sp. RSA 1286]|nr:hypothetical protein IWW45_007526 [Coemansia sp. RSA 485]KAJ2638047.1 hypothetical protein GGF40_001936 [Coemansia sp. RSA 1286]
MFEESKGSPDQSASVQQRDMEHPPKTILSWSNVEYKVPEKTILKGVSGHVNAGETVALIGSSGAGKTTLLNALSGRIIGGQLYGDICFQGAKRDPKTFKQLTAYVQQDDLMHPLLTVEETLGYAAKLRLSSSAYSQKQKVERVNTVIRQLRLEAARNTRIGDAATRGVSGGERKRVSIGTELLTDPRLLFLDEPTSGLDSNSSEMVVELVKSISVEHGIATIMTIHQPNARIFNIFDKVILLSQGSVVYFGPTSSAIHYFAGIGYQCPVHENPADFFVDLMTLDYRSEETLLASKERVESLVEQFSAHRNKMDMLEDDTAQKRMDAGVADDLSETITEQVSIARNSWVSEFAILLRRDWTNIFRNTYYLISQLLQPLGMGLMIGFMFYYLKHDSLSAQNRLGVLYIIVVEATFPVFMPQVALLVDDLLIAIRERSCASYRPSTYYMAKISTYVPIALICNFLFYVAVYFISRLEFNAGKFFIGLAVFYCLIIVTIGLMFVFAAAFKSIAVIYVLSTAAITTELLFSGLFVNFHSVTKVLRWMRWLNPIYYSFSALGQNEMNDMKLECEPQAQCFSTGRQALESYSLHNFNIWQNTLFLLLIGLVFYIGGYVLLRRKTTPKYVYI